LAISGKQLIRAILFWLHNTCASHVIERLQKVVDKSGKALEEGVIIVVEKLNTRYAKCLLGNNEKKDFSNNCLGLSELQGTFSVLACNFQGKSLGTYPRKSTPVHIFIHNYTSSQRYRKHSGHSHSLYTMQA